MLGNNPDDVSDKTVAVIKFETLSGQPLAILSNYAVHGTVLGAGNLQISADLPGATSRLVETHHSDRVVAPWTSGAAGDQDPIYRVGTDFKNVAALGRILGNEVVRVADGIRTSPRGRIRAVQKVVTCSPHSGEFVSSVLMQAVVPIGDFNPANNTATWDYLTGK